MAKAYFGEDSLAVFFQGQNVSYPGMGKELYSKFEAAREVINTANEVLDFDVREVCWGGLTHLLDRPRYVQPATVAVELAEFRVWQDVTDGTKFDLATGLSLGMYPALAAVGSAEDATVLDIVGQRGKIVDKNLKYKPGGMLTVKGIPHPEMLDELIRKTKAGIAVRWGGHGLVTLSGTNRQIVKAERIANGWDGVEAVVSKVKERAHNIGQKRTQKPLIKVLQEAEIVPPSQALLLSNDPKEHETGFLQSKVEIVHDFADQMVEPVDMGEVNEVVALSGIARVIEFGPDREFGLTSQLTRKTREDRVRTLREQMGRDVVRRVKFDYEAIAA